MARCRPRPLPLRAEGKPRTDRPPHNRNRAWANRHAPALPERGLQSNRSPSGRRPLWGISTSTMWRKCSPLKGNKLRRGCRVSFQPDADLTRSPADTVPRCPSRFRYLPGFGARLASDRLRSDSSGQGWRCCHQRVKHQHSPRPTRPPTPVCAVAKLLSRPSVAQARGPPGSTVIWISPGSAQPPPTRHYVYQLRIGSAVRLHHCIPHWFSNLPWSCRSYRNWMNESLTTPSDSVSIVIISR